jgi:hypothetical protein
MLNSGAQYTRPPQFVLLCSITRKYYLINNDLTCHGEAARPAVQWYPLD